MNNLVNLLELYIVYSNVYIYLQRYQRAMQESEELINDLRRYSLQYKYLTTKITLSYM